MKLAKFQYTYLSIAVRSKLISSKMIDIHITQSLYSKLLNDILGHNLPDNRSHQIIGQIISQIVVSIKL